MAILDDTRADWRARKPLRPLTRVPWSQRIGVSWHWIGPGRGPSASGPHQKCLDQVREWQRQHQAKGWKDVGYPALICQHARAIEGRGLDTEGSHSPGVNWEHVGIQFMVGEDTPGGVTPAMFARAQRLRADIGQLGKNIRRDWRHKDDPEASTECCGPQIGAWVLSGGPTKNPAPPQEDDMPLTPTDIDKVADEVWTRPVVDAAGKRITAGQGFGIMLRNSQAGLELAKKQASVGRPLTAAEIKAIVDASLDEKIADATETAVIVTKPEAQ